MRTIKQDKLYCVIDLSGGTSAESYPVSFLDSAPEGGWSDEYKTTKLVLRRIEPGTFMMGSPDTEVGRMGNEDYHQVTITKPYYIGVFEVTDKQWSLIDGGTYDTKKPVMTTYENIRGSVMRKGSNVEFDDRYYWPQATAVNPSLFMGKLRSRTMIQTFDLPTEAQWEYAAKGGCERSLNIGMDCNENNVLLVGRCENNYLDGKGDAGLKSVTYVGCYMPNSLGLYDMLGNAAEWCLDGYEINLGKSSVVDPVGCATPTYFLSYGTTRRVIKGGGYGLLNMYDGSSCKVNPSFRVYSYDYPITDYERNYGKIVPGFTSLLMNRPSARTSNYNVLKGEYPLTAGCCGFRVCFSAEDVD